MIRIHGGARELIVVEVNTEWASFGYTNESDTRAQLFVLERVRAHAPRT